MERIQSSSTRVFLHISGNAYSLLACTLRSSATLPLGCTIYTFQPYIHLPAHVGNNKSMINKLNYMVNICDTDLQEPDCLTPFQILNIVYNLYSDNRKSQLLVIQYNHNFSIKL